MKNNQIRIAALATAIMPFSALKAAAASEGLETPDTAPTYGSMTGSLVTVLIALAVIIGLIIFAIKFLARRNRGWGANRALRALGGVPLGQHKSIQVVELAGKVYVVGIGEDVRLLDRIDDPEEAARIINQMEQTSGAGWNPAAFSDLMNRFRNRGDQTTSETKGSNEGPDFELMLRQKLDEQSQRKQQVETLLRSSNQSDRLMDDE
ncbi:FliO/MopB family protein [Paenibacillus kobensis]|uniref:FliO/MopB family protein n=1 Tax=Paenibacillus kobensis TaxID=59841 RepID=UPI000FDC19D5|nr:flagellar biosynthetic protein FliO [Paenibacillus kobensis]